MTRVLSRSRLNNPRPLAVVAMAVVIAALLGTAIYALVFYDSTTRARVSPEEFQEVFNSTAEELDASYRLPDPSWRPDERLGLDVSNHSVGARSLIELYRDADGHLAAVLVLAQPDDDQERAGFTVLATAAIAGALDTSTDDATNILADRLSFDGSGDRDVNTTYERNGLRLDLLANVSSTQLSIAETD